MSQALLTTSVFYPQFNLNDWSGVTPVILPFEPRTLSCIGIASAGVAVPFFLFLVAMFYLLVPIWLQNFHSDKYTSNDLNSSSNGISTKYQQDTGHVDLMLLHNSNPQRMPGFPPVDGSRLNGGIMIDGGGGVTNMSGDPSQQSYFSGARRGTFFG